ncbi:MAG: DUF4380 domain-containing protein [Nitrospiraceae bacterium]
MSKVLIEQSSYKGWDASRIQNGPLELLLVPQVGGRTMGMRWRGHELAFTQPEREGRTENLSVVRDVRTRKREIGRILWGGDKTWLAPQDRWTDGFPFLDLDSGSYAQQIEQVGNEAVVIRMVSPVDRETGVQISRTLTVLPGSTEWLLTHELHNASSAEVTWGVWDVSMVLRPAKVYLPTCGASQYPGGVRTYPEEGESVQVRDRVVQGLGSLAVITCDRSSKFKFGVGPGTDTGKQQRSPDRLHGKAWMLGILDVKDCGLVAYRKQIPVFDGRPYAHGCIAEVYNSDEYEYLEMEIHGPLVTLRPGQTFEITERQALFEVTQWPTTEAQVLELVSGPPGQ